MQELDDITLKRVTRGDRRAFKKLYDHYAPFIWKVLFPMSNRDINTARELTQDTFVKAYKAAGSFKGNSAFSTWLYRIAYSAAMEYYRKIKTVPSGSIDPDLLSGNDSTETFDNKEIAARILTSLSTEDRFLIVSREINAVSFEELETVTGIKSGALRTRLHRLKESIRNAFPEEKAAVEGGVYVEA